MIRMIGFFAAFLFVFGMINLYLFIRIMAAVQLSGKKKWWLGAAIMVMTCGPLITHGAGGLFPPAAGVLVAYCSFCWMGFVLYFFFLHLALDLGRFVVLIIMLAVRRKWQRTSRRYHQAVLTLVTAVALATMVYGFFEAANLTTEYIHVSSDRIPAAAGTIRIVQVSDLHIGVLVNRTKVARIAALIARLKPDILVSTGDLVEAAPDNYDFLTGILHELEAPLGKFAVTGNHEFYAGIAMSLDFTSKSGFTMLRGDSASIPGTGITIAGVDDMNRGFEDTGAATDERVVLATIPANQFIILLKHRPVVIPETVGTFDLMLSGHTHQGQFFPFKYLVERIFPYSGGFYELGGGSRLYVSRGAGTWGPPIRVGVPPEVTVIELSGSGH